MDSTTLFSSPSLLFINLVESVSYTIISSSTRTNAKYSKLSHQFSRLYTLLWLNRWLHMLSFSGLARISTAWSYYRSHRIASLYFMGYYGCSFYIDDQSLGYAWTMMCYKSIERIWTHSFSATSAAFFFVKLWHRLHSLHAIAQQTFDGRFIFDYKTTAGRILSSKMQLITTTKTS